MKISADQKRVTLSIISQVIDETKPFAKHHRKSLSKIVEDCLKTLGKKISKEIKFDPLIEELASPVKHNTTHTYKELLLESNKPNLALPNRK